MSNIVYEEWMVAQFLADATLLSLVGRDTDNQPAVYPYHYQSQDERVPYPHLTFARFGTADPGNTSLFQSSQYLSVQMDSPKFALCAWSTNSLQEADALYSAAQLVLQGPNATTATSSLFGQYQLKRTLYRNDLYDDDAKAYHVHAEYRIWISKNFGA